MFSMSLYNRGLSLHAPVVKACHLSTTVCAILRQFESKVRDSWLLLTEGCWFIPRNTTSFSSHTNHHSTSNKKGKKVFIAHCNTLSAVVQVQIPWKLTAIYVRPYKFGKWHKTPIHLNLPLQDVLCPLIALRYCNRKCI